MEGGEQIKNQNIEIIMSVIVPIIVIGIILTQIFFFIKNIKRMDEYRKIFEKEKSWGIAHDFETDLVSGIRGEGNSVFVSIKDSINKYLGNNTGSVIDFQLLKDAVDRHCETVENDINTLTPIPLYCGLAGTMAGVIVGLASLLGTGSITALLSSGDGNFGAAANGVNDLLAGVAWAMLASICGIIFTTAGSICFKKYKFKGERGKNTFLAWLQAKLLPELPTDTADALKGLVQNLNEFNSTFSENTTSLRGALQEVNESYSIQAEIIQAVHDMDVMKMAKANVQVLKELKDCTDKLEQFNDYLDGIEGYTDAIYKFTEQFESEADRIHVLEEIRDFFRRHKGEISKELGSADAALRDAMKSINESASDNSKELKDTLTKQAEEFKRIIQEQKDAFEEVSENIKANFIASIKRFPDLEEKLSEISNIPSKLNMLIDCIERSNSQLSAKVEDTMKQTVKDLAAAGASGTGPVGGGFPSWMKWTIVASAILIAAACLTNTVYNIGYAGSGSRTELSDSVAVTDTTYDASAATDASQTTPDDSIRNDSIH